MSSEEIGFLGAPSHYAGERETIDVIRDQLGDEGFVAFCRGNAIKYRARAGRKGSADTDLGKAVWYEMMAVHITDGGPDPRAYRVPR